MCAGECAGAVCATALFVHIHTHIHTHKTIPLITPLVTLYSYCPIRRTMCWFGERCWEVRSNGTVMEADQSDRSEGNVAEFNGSTISAPAGGSVDLRSAFSTVYNTVNRRVPRAAFLHLASLSSPTLAIRCMYCILALPRIANGYRI